MRIALVINHLGYGGADCLVVDLAWGMRFRRRACRSWDRRAGTCRESQGRRGFRSGAESSHLFASDGSETARHSAGHEIATGTSVSDSNCAANYSPGRSPVHSLGWKQSIPKTPLDHGSGVEFRGGELSSSAIPAAEIVAFL